MKHFFTLTDNQNSPYGALAIGTILMLTYHDDYELDRYAGSLDVVDPETGKPTESCGWVHEDNLGDFGVEVDYEAFNKSKDTTLFNFIKYVWAEALPTAKMTPALNKVYFDALTDSVTVTTELYLTKKCKRNFAKLDTVLKYVKPAYAHDKSFNCFPAVKAAVTRHNKALKKANNKKQEYKQSTANSLANLCPELANIKF